MSASRAMTSASAGVAGVSTIRPGAAGGEDAAQAAWHAGNAQWRPALFPAERIGGLASLQPATLRLAADVRYGGHSRRSDGQQGFAECPLGLQWRPNLCVATNRREWDGPAVLPPRTAQRMTGGLEA